MQTKSLIALKKITRLLFNLSLLFLLIFLVSCGNVRKACAKGNLKEVKTFLKNGGDVDLKNDNQQTLLHTACHNQHLDVVKLLVENGADVNAVDKYVGTPLQYATRQDNIEIAKYLILMKADVNKSTKRNGSPLFAAARYNRLGIAKVLISAGADPNLKNANFTASHMAALNGSSDVLSLLIKHNANINAVDANGNTPLHKTTNFNSLLCAQILIKNGADITKKNKNGKTAFDIAKEKKCKPVLIKLLDPKNNKPNTKNRSQSSKKTK